MRERTSDQGARRAARRDEHVEASVLPGRETVHAPLATGELDNGELEAVAGGGNWLISPVDRTPPPG